MGWFSSKKEVLIEKESLDDEAERIARQLFVKKEEDCWLDEFKEKSQLDLLYTNFTKFGDQESNLSYLSQKETPILHANLSCIEDYRKLNTYVLKPKDFKDILIKEKLEIGLLRDATFLIDKKVSASNYNIREYGSERLCLPEMLNEIGIFTNRFYNYGYNLPYEDDDDCKKFGTVMNNIIPCYDSEYLKIKDDSNKDRMFVVGKNLQFLSENITDQKLIEATLFVYNPNMKMFAVYPDRYWTVDNRTEEEKAMRFKEYVNSQKEENEINNLYM